MYLRVVAIYSIAFYLLGCGGASSGPTPTPITPPTAPMTSTTVTADFSVPVDNPLIKDKIGVYQTPFMGTAGIAPRVIITPLLGDAGAGATARIQFTLAP